MGTAMYAAFALGAPAGAALYGPFGFTAIALITTVIPLLTLAIVVRLQRVAPTARVRASFLKVVSAVSLLALDSRSRAWDSARSPPSFHCSSPRGAGRYGPGLPYSRRRLSQLKCCSDILLTAWAARRSRSGAC